MSSLGNYFSEYRTASGMPIVRCSYAAQGKRWRGGLSVPTLNFKRLQELYEEAIPLFERALSIRTKKLGPNHPDTIGTQTALDTVRRKVKVREQNDRCRSKAKLHAQPIARWPGAVYI